MQEITRPEHDPALQEKALQEMMWALEFAGAQPVSARTAGEIWRVVRGRAGLMARARAMVPRGWREIAATLVPESLVPSPAVRGGDAANARLMVYETDEFAVSLAFTSAPESPRVALTGQVVPRATPELPAGGRVEVWSGAETHGADLNEHGEFAFAGLPHGDLHMDIRLGADTIIQISPIHTKGARTTEI